MAASWSSPENSNPTFLITQAAGIALRCCHTGLRILTIAKLYPERKQIERREWEEIPASLNSMHSAYLAPRSDTEDPFGGTVLLHQRRQFALWFSQRPEVRKAFAAFIKMRVTFANSLAALCAAPSLENQRAFKRHLDQFGELAKTIADSVNPTPAATKTRHQSSVASHARDLANDDLVTIEEISFLSGKAVKTLRNNKSLGKPDVLGGGRGVQAKWKYERISQLLEATFRDLKMPSWDEAVALLKR